MSPSTLIKGKTVFSKNGAQIGIVSSIDLEQDTNTIVSIVVKKGWFGKNVVISKKFISSADSNVILNITKSELDLKMSSNPKIWSEKV